MSHIILQPTKPIVIHAGFHKTGTSSVQQALRKNRAALKPICGLALKPKLEPILQAARDYSTWRDPVSLMAFTYRLDHWIATLPPLRHRGLILSAEELVGHMPGRGDLATYRAATPLMVEIRDAFLRKYKAPDLQFVFGTRAAESWLNSAYWEHVKSSSMTLGLDDFKTRYTTGADLSVAVDHIRQAVAPYPVTQVALETSQNDPFGPATTVLALAGVSALEMSNLTPVAITNTRLAPEVLDQLLDLNRKFSDRVERSAAKKALLQQTRQTRI